MKKYFFLLFPIAFLCVHLHHEHLKSTITEKDIKDYEARMSSSKVIDELQGPIGRLLLEPVDNIYSDGIVQEKYMYTLGIELFMGLWYLTLLLIVIRYIFQKVFKRKGTDKEDSNDNNEQQQ